MTETPDPDRQLVEGLKRAVRCLYLLVDATSARPLADGMTQAADALTRLLDARDRLPLLVRERDRLLEEWDAARAQVQALEAELAKWKTCARCGQKMEAPGYCSQGEAEFHAANEKQEEELFERLSKAEQDRDQLKQDRDNWRDQVSRLVKSATRFALDLASEQAAHAETKAKMRGLEQAQAADEDRLREAGERAGVLWCGCDTPDVLADEVLAERAAHAETRRKLEALTAEFMEYREKRKGKLTVRPDFYAE